MNFKDYQELQNELSKIPSDENIIFEDEIYWLKQDYAINRMNEVYGEGNWAIEKIRKNELKNETGQVFGNTCILTVSYKHPISEEWLEMDGVSGTNGLLDNNIIGRAFLNAIGHLGNTFGRKLSYQFE